MQIVLNEDEMKSAIRDYITSQGLDTLGKEIEVDLTAGRGANGFSASINLIPVVPTGNKMEDNFKPASKNPVMEEANSIVEQAAWEPIVKKEKPAAKSKEPALAKEDSESTELDFSTDTGPMETVDASESEEPNEKSTDAESIDDVQLFFNS